ncbi:uncharacterized protein BX663DRAFT_500063, partial [Cokeromyces recurvatus]|uniref:uncharacterized protein n=1 Tax=Cokeromyces recurvatus TaxID=90255 RepID=UPI0022206D0D
MPFDTVERSFKKFRTDINFNDEEEWYMKCSTFSNHNTSTTPFKDQLQHGSWENKSPFQPITHDSLLPSSATPIDIPYSTSSAAFDHPSNSLNTISPQSNHHYYWDDNTSLTESISSLSHPSFINSSYSPIHLNNLISSPPLDTTWINNHSSPPIFTDVLSRIKFSYSDIGINLEAKISNASELSLLIDAFSHLCCSSSSSSSVTTTTTTTNQENSDSTSSHDDTNKVFHNKMLLCRNKLNQTKPVNFFASTCTLGQNSNPLSNLDSLTSQRKIVDACIDIFFKCWVRYKPILKKDEFMTWYESQHEPTETLIVNAICAHVFRHMVIHHPQQSLDHFLKDQDKLQEQEEYFFSRARECLSQSFDTPDRYTIIALLFMSIRADPSKGHHYVGMAASALHELNIYPRMVNEDVDSYDKEMDTRLWWFVWAIDFYHWSAGAHKNTPQPFIQGEIDLPKVFEQDIDETEISVITFTYCLMLWKIQADIVTTFYLQDHSTELVVEQLIEYDRRLSNFYRDLPDYLIFDSGFEYGCEELFLACLRVNIEYNATLIILHKLFIPEMNPIRPSQTSLESLNSCLSAALTQLSAIKTCTMTTIGHCAFDRDELWRAAEVISVAMDIYHHSLSPKDQMTILKNIKLQDFMLGLTKSYQILQNTREFRFAYKNWLQVADWIQAEIRRHQLAVGNRTLKHQFEDESNKKNKPDYFLAHLKPNPSTLSYLTTTKKKREDNPSVLYQQRQSSTRKSISFQNQFSVQPAIHPSSSSLPSSTVNIRKSSFSTAPPFVHFTNYTSSDKQKQQPSSNGKNHARFRYFNPRKMNKFLFIDEHPM